MSVLGDKLRELREIPRGRERDMYPILKEIFSRFLGHESSRVHTDVRVASGGVPDVYVDVATNGLFLHRWIVVEAKDEPGVFCDTFFRNRVFEEKRRYVGVDTEWFVFVDPETWVVRRLVMGQLQGEDHVVLLAGVTPGEFLSANECLTRDAAVERELLRQFKEGREDRLSSLDLGTEKNRQFFFESLEKSYRLLEEGCWLALRFTESQFFSRTWRILDRIREIWGREPEFRYLPFEVVGVGPNISETLEVEEYRTAVRELRRLHYQAPRVFRLAINMRRRLREASSDAERDRCRMELVFYTVLSLLSRILMLRFLEDHGFFGEDKKYLCNGGVRAFEEMRRYFKLQYPHLIRQACEFGAAIYPPLFSEGEYDWVFDCPVPEFSERVEQVLFYLSFFDFTSVREDVLSGVYQKVQKAVRPRMVKELGIVFTPPSVARYLVKRCRKILGDAGGDYKVLDPACGTGTFLLEWFEETLGDAVRRGVVSYETVRGVLGKIAGNDINPVALSIAQMQMLWRLLPYAGEIKECGFPEVRVSAADALKIRDLFSLNSEWDIIETDQYQAVLGNPPYIRPEVWERTFGSLEERFYGPVSARSNSRTLFVFKAMEQWLQEGGVLGFVLPLSVLDSEESQSLRELFALGSGKWRIVEIVDMEEIAEHVFPQVSVNPILFIAKKETPSESDTVTLRVARPEAVIRGKQGFEGIDFSRFDSVCLEYSKVFSLDGEQRVLTRLNPARRDLVEKIASFPTWRDIAKKYWVRYQGRRIVEASPTPPSSSEEWEERRMLGMGAAFRRRVFHRPDGLPVYKGEHILACQLLAEQPADQGIDMQSVDDPSFWRFFDILPETGFAFQQISLNLTACRFDPRREAFLNTATLFFPDDRLKGFPFDFLVLSTLFRWYFAIALRVGVIGSLGAHIYPRTVARLPWIEVLAEKAPRLNALREKYLEACRYLNQDLVKQLYDESIQMETLQERAVRLTHIEIRWPDGEAREGIEWHRYCFDSLFDFFEVNDWETYELLCMVLPLLGINTADRTRILEVRLPASPEGGERWRRIAGGADRRMYEDEKRKALDELDEIVAEAFKLEPKEQELIKKDTGEDPFLKRLCPTEPYTTRRLRGFRSGLERPDRYRRQ